jgi:hypothetical protein
MYAWLGRACCHHRRAVLLSVAFTGMTTAGPPSAGAMEPPPVLAPELASAHASPEETA